MSYILEALRKADRENHAGEVPTVDALHGSRSGRRVRVWPWAVAGALLLNAVVFMLVLRPSASRVPIAADNSPSTSSAAPAVADPPIVVTSPPAPRVFPPQASVSPSPSTAATPSTPPSPAALPSAPAPRAAQKLPRAEAPGRAAPPTSITARADTGEAASPATTGTLEREESRAKPAAKSLAAGAALKVDVLVYSENPALRAVYIAGRRYTEGQPIGDGVRVDEIARDGVFLKDHGQRFFIRH